MAQFVIKGAARPHRRLRLAIVGVSGSGKTYTGISIGVELAKRVDSRLCVIDTEHSSAHLYGDRWGYDVMDFPPPYDPIRYNEALLAARDAGYKVVMIDSFSHAWAGEGGILERVDMYAERNAGRGGKNDRFGSGWRYATPEHNRLVNNILVYPGHVIVTLRSKTRYEIVDGKPRKMGMEAVQREGVDYEFDHVLEIDQDHRGIMAKTRFFDLDRRVFLNPSGDGEFGQTLIDEMLKGDPEADADGGRQEQKIDYMVGGFRPAPKVDWDDLARLEGMQDKLDRIRQMKAEVDGKEWDDALRIRSVVEKTAEKSGKSVVEAIEVVLGSVERAHAKWKEANSAV